MWKLMNESWIWVAAAIDMAISSGLAYLLVRYFGWECCTIINVSLGPGSVLAYTILFGVYLPIIFFFGGALVVGIVDSRMEYKNGIENV